MPRHFRGEQMTDNIVMPQPLAIALRQALDEWRATSDQWIEKTITLALKLKAARDACISDVIFHVWLDKNGFGEDVLSKNVRAALINMAKYHEVSRKILQLTDRRSVELIWDKEIKPIIDFMVSERSETEPKTQPSSNTQETAPPAPENSEPAPQQEPQARGEIKPGPKSGLYGRPSADKISQVFLNRSKTRVMLGHLNGPTWKLLLQAYEGGLLPIPTEATIHKQTARIFFPYGSERYLNGFDLTSRTGRTAAVDLLAQMIAHKDDLLAEPERVEAILTNKQQARKAEQKAAVVQERATKALAALPPDESEVIMFGKRLWPIVEGETIGAYDFRTLQVAVWKFRDLNCWMHRDSPRTRGINIRNSTKWDRHFIGELLKDSGEVRFKIDRIYQLVHALCSLMEQNPDGECREPLTPLVLG